MKLTVLTLSATVINALLFRRLGFGAILAALAWGGAVHAAESKEGVVLERVVAVVEGRIITLTELRFEARVALVQTGGAEAATTPLDDSALRSALDWAVGQRLQESEAERLRAFSIEPSDVEAALRAFESRFRSDDALAAFLAQHEADEVQLARLLRRGVRAERMLDSKVRLKAQVTEAEVKGAYAARGYGPAEPYEKVRGELRERLFRERYTQLAKVELTRMRERADIRWVAPFAQPTPGGEAEP